MKNFIKCGVASLLASVMVLRIFLTPHVVAPSNAVEAGGEPPFSVTVVGRENMDEYNTWDIWDVQTDIFVSGMDVRRFPARKEAVYFIPPSIRDRRRVWERGRCPAQPTGVGFRRRSL